jgi:hypothetical protein
VAIADLETVRQVMARTVMVAGITKLGAGIGSKSVARGSFLIDSIARTPYGLLMCGIFFLVLAVNGTCTGEAWARFGRIVCRAKEPKEFRRLVVVQYLGGASFIGYYLYKVYGN